VPHEFRQIRSAFVKTMLPHIDQAKLKVVQSRDDGLLAEGSEPIPKWVLVCARASARP